MFSQKFIDTCFSRKYKKRVFPKILVFSKKYIVLFKICNRIIGLGSNVPAIFVCLATSFGRIYIIMGEDGLNSVKKYGIWVEKLKR